MKLDLASQDEGRLRQNAAAVGCAMSAMSAMSAASALNAVRQPQAFMCGHMRTLPASRIDLAGRGDRAAGNPGSAKTHPRAAPISSVEAGPVQSPGTGLELDRPLSGRSA
jgi:hypothetical protein